MKSLGDNQLPVALARFLASRGLDCKHVGDFDLAAASDAEIWKHASENDCIVISKDVDFLYLANAPAARSRLIWVRVENCRTKRLLAAVERVWPKIETELKAGARVIELR